jgi:hypothetical protein
LLIFHAVESVDLNNCLGRLNWLFLDVARLRYRISECDEADENYELDESREVCRFGHLILKQKLKIF